MSTPAFQAIANPNDTTHETTIDCTGERVRVTALPVPPAKPVKKCRKCADSGQCWCDAGDRLKAENAEMWKLLAECAVILRRDVSRIDSDYRSLDLPQERMRLAQRITAITGIQ